jgi:hypothetical protein
LSPGEVEQYVKGDRFIQLAGSHVTTEQAKLEEVRDRMMPDLWTTRQAQKVGAMEMER